MTLLRRVATHLERHGSRFAVIGAVSLAVHGIARSTQDVDLLVTDRQCLDPAYWASLSAAGVEVAVHRGDDADPLAGVTRLRAAGLAPVDVVVGKARWQSDVIARAAPALVEGVDVPAASPADLILLKLYAGGPQDLWDIAQLLAALDRVALTGDVESRLADLPPEARSLWARAKEA